MVDVCSSSLGPLLLFLLLFEFVSLSLVAGRHLTRATHGDPAGANVPPRPVMVMGTYQPPYEVLTEPERAAAAALGWDTEAKWAHEAMPPCTEKLWEELGDEERAHAET